MIGTAGHFGEAKKEHQMTGTTVWQELNSTAFGELFVIYDDGIALVQDGEHLWIADAARLRQTIEWARTTPADAHFPHLAYASFWGRCPGWIVTDIGRDDVLPLDKAACIHALSHAGCERLIPQCWLESMETKI
jgi:hypothetical protein